MIPAGLELRYKNLDIIYSGFQKDNKLCFYIKDDSKGMIYLSLLQFNEAYKKYEIGNPTEFDSDNLETYFL
jgi:hypothetical protein